MLLCICRKNPAIGVYQWDEPNEEFGDIRLIAALCDDCVVIHWAWPLGYDKTSSQL